MTYPDNLLACYPMPAGQLEAGRHDLCGQAVKIAKGARPGVTNRI
jgi:hypothetical protein